MLVKLTIDLGGEYIWVDCEKDDVSSTLKPLPCNSSQCRNRLYDNTRACMENDTICMDSPYNPISSLGSGSVEKIARDFLSVQSTDGTNPGSVVSVPNYRFTCAPSYLLQGLASGVHGMAGLGRSNLDSVPLQFASAFRIRRKFALCLSSSTTASKGVVLFGNGPYNFLPNKNDDVAKSLTYTPLILNRVSLIGSFANETSSEYFIGVTAVKVNGKSVPLNKTLLSFHGYGNGGTKISTVSPYTVLERSIYGAVVGAFVRALGNVPRVKPVAPFGACFNTKRVGTTRTGLAVPTIDFVLQSEKVVWRMYGTNTMVKVSDDVACLGFVDAGVHQPVTSIVIGGHQIEDNLLQFDLAKSRLGFSSSLLLKQTSCSNFNFTSIG